MENTMTQTVGEQSAMQDLRNDLVETISSSTEALEEINNEEIRLACQDVVKRTLNTIIKRIDDELLEKEKNQIEDAYLQGFAECDAKEIMDFEKYYKQTFNRKNMKKRTKHQLGLIPKEIYYKKVNAERFKEVCEAIVRYYNAGLEIKIEWIKEYNELIKKK